MLFCIVGVPCLTYICPGISSFFRLCRCIPVQCKGNSPEGVRVLLVSSRNLNADSWVFPKGGWELDENVRSAARRETVEESGVRGKLEEPMLGSFRFQNRKASPGSKGCLAYMYVLHVEEELAQFPEQAERIRKWVCFFTDLLAAFLQSRVKHA